MPGKNDLAVNDAYAALAQGGNAVSQLRPTAPFFIEVNAQAGDAVWQDGIFYRLHVLVHDLTASTTTLNQIFTGHLQDASWPTQTNVFHLPITSGPQDTIYRITTVLTAGIANSGLNVFQSELFVVTN